jgi:hypothetical protein
MARELKRDTVSPFLEHLWNEYFVRTGDTVPALAIRAGLSYGYVLKCVHGRIVPKQKALKGLCEAAGIDYVDTWQKLRNEPIMNIFLTSSYEGGAFVGFEATDNDQHTGFFFKHNEALDKQQELYQMLKAADMPDAARQELWEFAEAAIASLRRIERSKSKKQHLKDT